MSVLPFQKIRLSIIRDRVEEALAAAQRVGVVEFQEVSSEKLTPDERTDFTSNHQASQLDFAISFLEPYEKQGTLSRVLEGTAVYATELEVQRTVREYPYQQTVAETHQLESELNTLDSKLVQLRQETRVLNAWRDLSHDLAQPLNTETTTTYPITVPTDEADLLEKELTERLSGWDLKYISQDSYILTFMNQEVETVREILNRYQIEIAAFPERGGSPRQALTAVEEETQELEARRQELHARAAELAADLPRLRQVAGYLHWQREQDQVRFDHGRGTESVVVFEGFCPATYLDELYRAVDEVTHAFQLDHLELAEGEEPPVTLENSRKVWPFESVTRLYGLPGSRDLDPTVFMAGFFFIFFGLCLTDVGYGVFLALLTGLVLLLYRVQRSLKQLLVLLFLGGLSSILTGVLFGGYFGVEVSNLPEWLQQLQKFDPINEPLAFFYLTLILGFIQVVVGTVLDIVRQAKHTTLTDGLLDNGPWLLLFLGVAVYVGTVAGILPAGGLGLWLAGLAAVLLVLTQGRKSEGLISKGALGLLSLYQTVNYFSDILSYSRLLALGLATSALAFSVNLIANLLNSMMPALVAPVVAALILVIGHTFTLVVNVLGAYIHTARLQFVEFFGKFLTGTGRDFRPFRREEGYVILEE